MASKQQIQTSEAILEKYGRSLKGKTILITGVAADSIAGELAVQLSTAQPEWLILSARAESRVQPIMSKIRDKDASVKTRFLQMDLSSQSDIRRAVASLEDVPKVDHVACVAGVMWPPYSQTVDGVELQFAVNYVANFLLVRLLEGKIESAGAGASVVVVASSAVCRSLARMSLPLDMASPTLPESCLSRSWLQSLQPKDCAFTALTPAVGRNDLFVCIALLIDICSCSLWPSEALYRRPSSLDLKPARLSTRELKDLDGQEYDIPPWTSTSEGAATIITGMLDPSIADSPGAFLHNNAVADEELHSHILDEGNWEKLWELSEKLIQE